MLKKCKQNIKRQYLIYFYKVLVINYFFTPQLSSIHVVVCSLVKLQKIKNKIKMISFVVNEKTW